MQKIIHFIVVIGMMVVTAVAYAEDKKPLIAHPQQENIQQNKIKPDNALEKISLHQQPDEKSSVVASIPANQAIIPIFIQGEWVKIADPTNGNVGWVSNETLKKHRLPIIKTLVQSINSANEASYRTMQYLSSDIQTEEMIKKWEAQRQGLQVLFNQMLEQNAKTFDLLTQELQDSGFHFPSLTIQKASTATTPEASVKTP